MHRRQRETARPGSLPCAHNGCEPPGGGHPVRQGIAADGGEVLQQALRQGDSIAVQVEQKGRPQGTFRLPHAHARRQRQRGQHMGGVVMADHEPVAQVGPGDVAVQGEGEAFRLRNAEVDGGDQGRRIGQGQEADVEGRAHQQISEAVMMARAMSPSRAFWFMAARRIMA